MTVARTASELSVNMPLSDFAKPLLQPSLSPKVYLDLLLTKKLYQDAALVMAHAMPKREAIWWGGQCVRLGYGTPPPSAEEILASAAKWVETPTDELRRSTYKIAETAGMDNPASLIALAVFYSSGSLSLPDLPEVTPKDYLTGNMVGIGVHLGALLNGVSKMEENYKLFFHLGFEVASGKNRWKEKKA